ncbi:hypothetical protein [Thalassospira xiamenensis]|uniref:Uncharacterized protein n=1 Tax=Thalassospira xiamenensis TaxID=220697 RepID=A0A285TTU9_9PROT|nr:hypothetical protein [Thalassospira xiamenensis]SOC27253.1 hypothetical protein SAMN05428964_105326 [Thalassospira xiamenensis]
MPAWSLLFDDFIGQYVVGPHYGIEEVDDYLIEKIAHKDSLPLLWTSEDGLYELRDLEWDKTPSIGLFFSDSGRSAQVGFYIQGMAWVEESHRGKGLGVQMIKVAAELMNGSPVGSSDLMGFSEAGEAAHRRAHREIVLDAYEKGLPIPQGVADEYNLKLDPHQIAKSEMFTLATTLRNFFEPHWEDWRLEKAAWMGNSYREKLNLSEIPISHNMCRLTCASAATILASKDIIAIVKGGEPVLDYQLDGSAICTSSGGMETATGEWRGHYWLEIPLLSLILDITGDQFGWEPVIVTDTSDPRYAANFTNPEISEALMYVEMTSEKWAGQWQEEVDIDVRDAHKTTPFS